MLRGSELLTQTLAQNGVTRLYSLSGNQIMPVFDACIDQSIQIVHTRHEGAAVFMAESHAQLTGQPGVALVTAGPGFGNALGALYSAYTSETPLLFLSGDSPIGDSGSGDNRGIFQEFPQCAAVEPFVKSTVRVIDAAKFPDMIDEAFSMAISGTPGPVHLALPVDVLNAEANVLANGIAATPKAVAPTERQCDEIMKRLMSASRPLIVTGPQLSHSRQRFVVAALEERLRIPVVCIESPRGLNDPALGAIANNFAEADLILYLGKNINFQTGFASSKVMPNAKLILVHPDPQEIIKATDRCEDRLVTVTSADAISMAKRLIGTASRTDTSTRTTDERWFDTVKLSQGHRPDCAAAEPISPAQLVKAVDTHLLNHQMAKSNTILVCDGGEFGQWAQAFATGDKRIINGASGAIGGSIPYAIAASISHPAARVVAFLGDGTAGFYLAEVETAVREHASPVFIIGNDSKWNAEYQIQLKDYGKERLIGCELGSMVDYAGCVTAMGGIGITINTHDELLATLQDLSMRLPTIKVPVCLNVALRGEPAPVIKSNATL